MYNIAIYIKQKSFENDTSYLFSRKLQQKEDTNMVEKRKLLAALHYV